MLMVHLFSGGDEFATGGVAILRFLLSLHAWSTAASVHLGSKKVSQSMCILGSHIILP